MTREEIAIKSCEDRIKHLKSAPPHHYGKRQRERAIELEKVKIKALRPVSREQVEQIKGVWIFNEDWWEFRCSECQKSIGNIEKFKFCPHCGAPMTGEAVGIRLKELEALNDGKCD